MLHAFFAFGVICIGVATAPSLGVLVEWRQQLGAECQGASTSSSPASPAASHTPLQKGRAMRPLVEDEEPQAICPAGDVAKIAIYNYQGRVRSQLTMIISTCSESWGVDDDCVNYYTRKELGLSGRCRPCVVDMAHCVRSWCWMYCWKKDPRTGFRRPTCFSCIADLCEKSFRRCALPSWMNQVDEQLDPPDTPAALPDGGAGTKSGSVPDTGQPSDGEAAAPTKHPDFALPTFGRLPTFRWKKLWVAASPTPLAQRGAGYPPSEMAWPTPASRPSKANPIQVWRFRWPWTQEETVELVPQQEEPRSAPPDAAQADASPGAPLRETPPAAAAVEAEQLLLPTGATASPSPPFVQR
eukprot:GGOE01015408.1.p1 GENE.GGOE01015408.1~~GGOE01015408.1.p1  ORF type:complete len:355 (+),score=55.72 GGOE01015408.1:39-1103(+)